MDHETQYGDSSIFSDIVTPLCNLYSWILCLCSSFVSVISDVIKNTIDEDLGLPEWSAVKSGFSQSFSEYLQKFEPFFVHLIEDFPASVALTSVAVPVVFVLIVNCLCCSKSKGNVYDSVDGIPVQNSSMLESKRWYRQAKCDFTAAINDVNREEAAPEWTCIKCQQAAEKAIKACVISKGQHLKKSWFGASQSNHFGHDLRENAQLTGDSHLVKLASTLQNIIGFASQMRYPDRHPYPKIPRDVFSESRARQALHSTDQLMAYVGNQYF